MNRLSPAVAGLPFYLDVNLGFAPQALGCRSLRELCYV